MNEYNLSILTKYALARLVQFHLRDNMLSTLGGIRGDKILSLLSFAAKISVVELILRPYSYLISARGRFPLSRKVVYFAPSARTALAIDRSRSS